MPKCLLVALLACVVSTAAAQDARPSRHAIRPSFARAVWAEPAPLRQSHEPLGGLLGPGDEDHRYEGFFVGAGLGVFATLTAVAMCDADSPCTASQVLLGGTIGSAMLGFAGAVLGGLIPKTP